ncbi:MAG: bifunctional diaminohydroxyphosphoribosylaminopyrimidine deaminase/5-amino-6-(5-phosphoribosylamino)uracil reductase RibD [Syntrophomonadaceae bacterium]|nr:bifunctional diaminohydroxyphosphoribosylaminopyrimidine deaminase/5-amino-6-(5-phosphoribosylamino)uracil reductase RibD [Syntrophomonadaceae bacterium]MDD3022638.1 bifunctional diaminohydroxyphosphoribosylaminopyrimidine deaminase/5-amino-6-(5-phosphoribosylamino)uracil reductase RibD [Syntrophomonadaceae bacterium]
MFNDEDKKYMYRALELADMARGRTSPNPLVGAVIVKDGKIIGEGYHRQAGTPHAEINAINDAGAQDLTGAAIYVTLEPCSHYGRTPPCADALVKAGLGRVVIAVLDPNPLVSGKGLAKLKEAGIATAVGLLEAEAIKLNEVFFKYIQSKKPFVSLKVAMTLDGKIASFSGDSRWITGEAARYYVHQLRNSYDAIMVGIGTVLADDPQLNTRLNITDQKDPVRVIIDGQLDLPLQSKIVNTAAEQRTIVFTSRSHDREKAAVLKAGGLEIIEIGEEASCLPLERVIEQLGSMGICSLLLEGGARINANMLEHNLIDKVYWFIAPKIIGGEDAPSPIAGQGIEYMKQAILINKTEIKNFADDLCIVGYIS